MRTAKNSPPKKQPARVAVRGDSDSLAGSPRAGESSPHWTFLTNHSHVLIALANEPTLVLREVALRVGITERAVQRIIAELEDGGFLEREKIGRKNQYRIRTDRPLRHPIEAHCSIGDLLALINDPANSRR